MASRCLIARSAGQHTRTHTYMYIPLCRFLYIPCCTLLNLGLRERGKFTSLFLMNMQADMFLQSHTTASSLGFLSFRIQVGIKDQSSIVVFCVSGHLKHRYWVSYDYKFSKWLTCMMYDDNNMGSVKNLKGLDSGLLYFFKELHFFVLLT